MKHRYPIGVALVSLCLVTGGCQVVSGLNDLNIDRKSEGEDTTEDEPTSGDTTTAADTSSSGECAIPSGLECAPNSNCGCDDQEVCALTNDDGDLTVSCQEPGQQESGDRCELGECGDGLLCVEGVCIASCKFDNDCEADNAKCADVVRPNGQTLKGIRYCQEHCDLVSPLEPSESFVACAEDQSCVASQSGSRCVNGAGNGSQGDDCDTAEECTAGFTCHSGVCKQWCSVATPDCGAGLDCEPVSEPNDATRGLGLCDGGCPASVPAGDECLTEPNCGCSQGETCRAMVDGSRACSPVGVTGNQAQCEDNSNCDEALACVGGLCRPYCDPTVGVCDDGSICLNVEYEGEAIEGVGACLGNCDPVSPGTTSEGYAPCGLGAQCIAGDISTQTPQSFCAAAPEDPGSPTGPCDEETYCGEGSACLVDRCFPFCREHGDCEGYTDVPFCFTDDLGYRGAPEDALGLCCSPLPVEGSECSAFDLECGCEDGFTCRSEGTEGRGVCSAVGEVGYQEPCYYDTDCGFANSCIGGLCRPHCDGECDVTQGACVQITSGDEEPIAVPYAFVCTGRCDPVQPERADATFEPCGAGAQCIAGWAGAADPISMGSFCAYQYYAEPVGGSCTFDNDCALGLGCDFRDCPVDDLECAGKCIEYCATQADCDEGSTCNLDVGRVVTPGTPVGYCDPIGAAGDAG